MTSAIESSGPGSLNSFSEANGFDPQSLEAVEAYTKALIVNSQNIGGRAAQTTVELVPVL
jgi:hypothetical protein